MQQIQIDCCQKLTTFLLSMGDLGGQLPLPSLASVSLCLREQKHILLSISIKNDLL